MKKSISYIFILLSGICWGCIGLSNRMLTQMGMGLGNRVFVRNFGTLVVLTVVFGLLHREVFRIKLRHLPIFLGSGLVSILLLSIVYFQCQTLCSLSVAAILLYLAPSFVVLISAVLWKTPLTGRKLAALGISLVGCVLVSGVLGGGATASLPGIALGVASGLCYASYTVFAHYGMAHYSSYTMIYWTFLVAGLGSVLLADFLALGPILRQPKGALGCVLVIVVSTALPYYLYTKGLEGGAGVLSHGNGVARQSYGRGVANLRQGGHRGAGVLVSNECHLVLQQVHPGALDVQPSLLELVDLLGAGGEENVARKALLDLAEQSAGGIGGVGHGDVGLPLVVEGDDVLECVFQGGGNKHLNLRSLQRLGLALRGLGGGRLGDRGLGTGL